MIYIINKHNLIEESAFRNASLSAAGLGLAAGVGSAITGYHDGVSDDKFNITYDRDFNDKVENEPARNLGYPTEAEKHKIRMTYGLGAAEEHIKDKFPNYSNDNPFMRGINMREAKDSIEPEILNREYYNKLLSGTSQTEHKTINYGLGGLAAGSLIGGGLGYGLSRLKRRR